ncbi:hypothetical protein [Pseudoalteromonas ardens]|uniref:Uncharacterized protein n=1 Tax=Pseudoalteromonas rubra TaxID=43658 RepID=A0A0L0EU35_9GAMM|nr:hypothetical protein [Pseudoalteromonas sp. R96]KNC67926.1 hypothetical protein AC626_07830 [Pseudoalteromonas rubra]MDK1309786.1 hypothetical protein [Pseudoalteromonas sp. R96]
MIKINFKPVAWLPDEKVKTAAATRQMKELITRLVDAPIYHTLTTEDRQQLIEEGYAPDLVDNLVLITLRAGDQPNDTVQTGFNYGAFDTALFSAEHLKSHFQHLNQGCCGYCESYLSATNAGKIGHIRPVELLEKSASAQQTPVVTCSPYYSLAYQQENLIYVCDACNDKYKGGRFPLIGQRLPAVSIDQEQPLLVSPYSDEPRHYIRFDPVTARAYPFDLLCAYLMDTGAMSFAEAEKKIWSHPEILQHAPDLSQLPGFAEWFQSLGQEKIAQLSKGYTSIEMFGLNRPELVVARLATLGQLHRVYAQFKRSENHDLPAFIDKLPILQYRSMSIDALHTWHHQTSTLSAGENKTKSITHQSDLGQSTAAGEAFPNWFRASLRYCVEESQLAQTQRRNLVFLSAKDKLYGQKAKEKCVFLPLNWQQDKHRLIKVRSHRNIWETSFSELASSRPMELLNLFTHNQVWVEGPFDALESA